MKIEDFRSSIDSVNPTQTQKEKILEKILMSGETKEIQRRSIRSSLVAAIALFLCLALSISVMAVKVPEITEGLKGIFGIKAELLTEMNTEVEVLDYTSTSNLLSVSVDSVIRDERNIYVLGTVERKDNKPFGEHTVFGGHDFKVLDKQLSAGWGGSYGFIENSEKNSTRTYFATISAQEEVKGRKFSISFTDLKDRNAEGSSAVVIEGKWSITFKAGNQYNAKTIKINDDSTSIEKLIVSPITISYYAGKHEAWNGSILIKYKDNSTTRLTFRNGISGYMSGDYKEEKYFVNIQLSEPLKIDDIATITVNGYEAKVN